MSSTLEQRWQRLVEDKPEPEVLPPRPISCKEETLEQLWQELETPIIPSRHAPERRISVVFPELELLAQRALEVLEVTPVAPIVVKIRDRRLKLAFNKLQGLAPIHLVMPPRKIRIADETLDTRFHQVIGDLLGVLVITPRIVPSEPVLPKRWLPELQLISLWNEVATPTSVKSEVAKGVVFLWEQDLERVWQRVVRPLVQFVPASYRDGDSFYALPVWEQELLQGYWYLLGYLPEVQRRVRVLPPRPVVIDGETLDMLWQGLISPRASRMPIKELPTKPTLLTKVPPPPKPRRETYWQKVRKTKKGWLVVRRSTVSFRRGVPVYGRRVDRIRPWELDDWLDRRERFEARAGLEVTGTHFRPKWIPVEEFLYRRERPEYREFEALLRAEENRLRIWTSGNPDLIRKHQGAPKRRRKRRSTWSTRQRPPRRPESC